MFSDIQKSREQYNKRLYTHHLSVTNVNISETFGSQKKGEKCFPRAKTSSTAPPTPADPGTFSGATYSSGAAPGPRSLQETQGETPVRTSCPSSCSPIRAPRGDATPPPLPSSPDLSRQVGAQPSAQLLWDEPETCLSYPQTHPGCSRGAGLFLCPLGPLLLGPAA